MKQGIEAILGFSKQDALEYFPQRSTGVRDRNTTSTDPSSGKSTCQVHLFPSSHAIDCLAGDIS